MSSSTMIHGETIRPANAIRTAAEAQTMMTSQTHAGTRAGGVGLTERLKGEGTGFAGAGAKLSIDHPGLERRAGELADIVDPDLRRCLGDPVQDVVGHRVAAGRDLECDGIE